MKRVLAVDPGLTTGYAIWHYGNRIEGELPAAKFLQSAASLIENKKVDAVACERFIISSQTGKLSQAPWSLEQIGVLRFLCERSNIDFTLQNAADAKRFASDERLKSMSWEKPPGAGHARDAQRHLLLYLVKNDLIDDWLLKIR